MLVAQAGSAEMAQLMNVGLEVIRKLVHPVASHAPLGNIKMLQVLLHVNCVMPANISLQQANPNVEHVLPELILTKEQQIAQLVLLEHIQMQEVTVAQIALQENGQMQVLQVPIVVMLVEPVGHALVMEQLINAQVQHIQMQDKVLVLIVLIGTLNVQLATKTVAPLAQAIIRYPEQDVL